MRMTRRSKIFLVFTLPAVFLAAFATIFASWRISEAAARTHWLGRLEPGQSPAVIIVLGMGATPEDAIDDRAELAAEVWKNSVAQKIVTSGGQGKHDEIAESMALRRHLVRRGVPNDAIIEENQSTSTFENLTYSARVLKEHGLAGATVAVVTHDFHAARSEEIARTVGLKAFLVSTPGQRLGNPVHMWCRELLAFWKWRILGW